MTLLDSLVGRGECSALLFDCDGTIADSMPIHHQAWERTLAKWNCPFPRELHEQWAGRPTRQIVEMLNQKMGLTMAADEIAAAKEAIYYTLLHTLEPIKPIADIVREYRGRLPMAVVSGSRRNSIKKTLGQLDLLEYFDVIVGAEDYKNGKPDPECFLTAAARVAAAPEKCVAFEDGILGLKSARAAGMRTVIVLPTGQLDWSALA